MTGVLFGVLVVCVVVIVSTSVGVYVITKSINTSALAYDRIWKAYSESVYAAVKEQFESSQNEIALALDEVREIAKTVDEMAREHADDHMTPMRRSTDIDLSEDTPT